MRCTHLPPVCTRNEGRGREGKLMRLFIIHSRRGRATTASLDTSFGCLPPSRSFLLSLPLRSFKWLLFNFSQLRCEVASPFAADDDGRAAETARARRPQKEGKRRNECDGDRALSSSAPIRSKTNLAFERQNSRQKQSRANLTLDYV